MEEQKAYYAIIPADVRYDDKLPANAKLLYGEITALTNEKGYCWAGNRYFADLYNVTTVTVSRWIKMLCDKGYLTSNIFYKSGTKEIECRQLSITGNKTIVQQKCYDPIIKNDNTPPIEMLRGVNKNVKTPIQKSAPPINKNVRENNTYNNTFNITSNKKKERRKKTGYDEIIDSLVENEELKDTLREFIKLRQMIKAPMTDKALKLLITKVSKMGDVETQIEILNQSIENSWKSVYPLKNNTTNTVSVAKSKFNNYTDTNKTNYEEIEKKLYDNMLGEY